jgi:hypothetical protein
MYSVNKTIKKPNREQNVKTKPEARERRRYGRVRESEVVARRRGKEVP